MEYNSLTEEEQIEKVRFSGRLIGYIERPSERVQLEAIKQNIYAYFNIKNPTEKVQIEVVRMEAKFISRVVNPSERVQLEAVKKNMAASLYIEYPTETVQLYIFERDIGWCKLVQNKTDLIYVLLGDRGDKYKRVYNKYMEEIIPYIIKDIGKLIIGFLI